MYAIKVPLSWLSTVTQEEAQVNPTLTAASIFSMSFLLRFPALSPKDTERLISDNKR